MVIKAKRMKRVVWYGMVHTKRREQKKMKKDDQTEREEGRKREKRWEMTSWIEFIEVSGRMVMAAIRSARRLRSVLLKILCSTSMASSWE